jgi:multidrug efflux pump subunit AcrA (membrane-fusion protein)
MAPWLIASALGIAVPMLLDRNKKANDQTPSNGQVAPGNVNWPGGMQQYPDPRTYQIPLDATIDPRSAYAVHHAFTTATAPQLVAFANEIRGSFPIAGTVLYTKALVLSELQQAQIARVRQEQALAAQQQAQAAAQAQAAQAAQAAKDAQAAQAQAQATRPVVPVVQEARLIPTVPIPGSELPKQEQVNGTPAPAAVVKEPVLVPAQGGVG